MRPAHPQITYEYAKQSYTLQNTQDVQKIFDQIRMICLISRQ